MSSNFVGGGRAAPSVRSVVLVVGSLLLLYVVFQAVSMRNDLAAALRSLDRAKVAVRDHHTDEARQLLAAADARVAAANRASTRFPMNVIGAVPLLGSPVAAVRGASDAAADVVDAARIVADAADAFPNRGNAGVDGHDLAPFHTAADRSTKALQRADAKLTDAAEALDGPAGAWLPPVSGTAKGLRSQVAEARGDLQGAQRGLAVLSDLTAPTTDARILILSQDSLELRATGGFIGSFGVLHFDNGTVNLERYDSFDALAPPDPPMEPPKYLAGALPKFWGLSNVNWWPDFPTTAETAKEMFRRQGGGDVHGVMALNETVMGDLLGVLGPIQVPGYREPVVQEGFADRVVYEVELKRPLDNPRKKFLVELSKLVFDRVFALPPDKVGPVATALDASVGRGDVQVWFADPERQKRVVGTSWSGELPRGKGDFLQLVDSNLEGSKSNRDLVRHVTYKVRRDGDDYFARLDVRYRNEGAATVVNPGYHGFLRVYAPRSAVLTDRSPIQGDLGPAQDGPFATFGTYVDVPPNGGERMVSFEYRLDGDDVAPDGKYHLTWLRQAGTLDDELVAVLGTSSVTADPAQRRLEVEHDFGGHPIMEFLRGRRFIGRFFE